MCRMCVITGKVGALPASNILESVLLRSLHEDGGQADGSGIFSGGRVVKTRSHFGVWDPLEWRDKIDPNGITMAHLRRASAGTYYTVEEAHPYQFDVGGETLTFMHNGMFQGAGDHAFGQPNTDSWRAARQLVQRMTPDTEINSTLLLDWLNEFREGSAYALVLHWKNTAYILRNNARTFFIRPLHNGYVGATSLNALNFTMSAQPFKRLMPVDSVSLTLTPDVLYRFPFGQTTDFTDCESVKPEFRKYQQTGFFPGVAGRTGTTTPITTPIITPPANQNGNGSGNVNDAGSDSDWYKGGGSNQRALVIAPPVTPPRIKVEKPEDQKIILPDARKRISAFQSMFTPLRGPLVRMWAAILLDRYTQDFTIDTMGVLQLPQAELDILASTMRGGREGAAFTNAVNLRINYWNHAVRPPHDLEAHLALWGTSPFWLPDPIIPDNDPAAQWKNYTEWRGEFIAMVEFLDNRERAWFVDVLPESASAVIDE